MPKGECKKKEKVILASVLRGIPVYKTSGRQTAPQGESITIKIPSSFISAPLPSSKTQVIPALLTQRKKLKDNT